MFPSSVSNHWTEIWNGTVNTQLQITCITDTVQCRLNYISSVSLGLSSHCRKALPTFLYIQACIHGTSAKINMYLIMGMHSSIVVVVLQSQTDESRQNYITKLYICFCSSVLDCFNIYRIECLMCMCRRGAHWDQIKDALVDFELALQMIEARVRQDGQEWHWILSLNHCS